MNANAIARQYEQLTPAERFPLILAAAARGDEVERERLNNTAGRIELSMPDQTPYVEAFQQLALLTIIELLAAAAEYLEWLDRADARLSADVKGQPKPRRGKTRRTGNRAADRPEWERYLQIAYAGGFMLKTKMAGWKLFCERRNFPPFWFWEGLPGFDRLQRALETAEFAAFTPDGMVTWLNSIRPEGRPEIAAPNLISVEKCAAESEAMFRRQVEWWKG
ncbi:MAG: hypothetical protein ACJ8F7_10500 [Gemmataceae bacterium]